MAALHVGYEKKSHNQLIYFACDCCSHVSTAHTACVPFRAALDALRSALEERRVLTRSPTFHSFKSKSVLSDAELDENADMPFPKDKPGASKI